MGCGVKRDWKDSRFILDSYLKSSLNFSPNKIYHFKKKERKSNPIPNEDKLNILNNENIKISSNVSSHAYRNKNKYLP